MKNIILAALVAVSLAAPARAQSMCDVLGEIAGNIMAMRQNGMSISQIVATTDGNPQMRDIVKALAIGAHETSRFSSEEYRTNAVQDFRNLVEAECYKREGGA